MRSGAFSNRKILTRKAIKPDQFVLSKPSIAFIPRKALLSAFSKFIPLSEQFSHMQTNVRLELEHALLGEDVRDNFALSGVIVPIAGVEEAAVEGHERVIKVALQASVSVGVDGLEGVWVGN
jgi:hypothetical protein